MSNKCIPNKKYDNKKIIEKERKIARAEYDILSLKSLINQINYRSDVLLKEIYDKYINNKDDISFDKFKKKVRNNAWRNNLV